MRLNKKGVSLPELIAVIVIMGIIAAIAIPGFGSMIKNAEKNATATEVRALVQQIELYIEQDSTVDLSYYGKQIKEIPDLQSDVKSNGKFGNNIYDIRLYRENGYLYIDFETAQYTTKVLDFSKSGCNAGSVFQGNKAKTIVKTEDVSKISKSCVV